MRQRDRRVGSNSMQPLSALLARRKGYARGKCRCRRRDGHGGSHGQRTGPSGLGEFGLRRAGHSRRAADRAKIGQRAHDTA